MLTKKESGEIENMILHSLAGRERAEFQTGKGHRFRQKDITISQELFLKLLYEMQGS